MNMKIKTIYFLLGICVSFVFGMTYVYAQEILASPRSKELSDFLLVKDSLGFYDPVKPIVLKTLDVKKVVLSDGVFCYLYINSISCLKP